MTATQTSNYQPHIDGLRAIAVLAVVLNHLDIGPFHGGFVGVDVFFVISGYLITGIVQREIENGRFTFARFYERRVRRLFPALFVMLGVVLALGVWLLLPSDLVKLARGTVATLGFGSNILFWRESGYFDGAAHFNPLLHTWSLAVEEQFYIVYPALLLLVHRFARSHLKQVLVLGLLASLALALQQQPVRPDAVFYLSPFRGWELLVGALLAIGAVPAVSSRALANGLGGLGLAVLLASLLWVQPGENFPGWQAVFPVLGTALLLHVGGHENAVAQRLLSLRPLVFVGLISYSLYLWHWPLLVFTAYVNGMQPLGDERWLVLAASLVVASLSYYWVEQPFRRPVPNRPAKRLFQRTAFAFATLAAAALLLLPARGLPGRFPAQAVALDSARSPLIPFRSCINHSIKRMQTGSLCVAGDRSASPDMLVWGDSHALAWAPVFDQSLASLGRSTLLAMESACPPLAGVATARSPQCRAANDGVLEQLAARPDVDTVVLIASWTSYAGTGRDPLHGPGQRGGQSEVFVSALQRTVARLQQMGKRVWIIGPTPGAPQELPFRLAMAHVQGAAEPAAISLSEFSRKAAAFDAALPAVLANRRVAYTDPRKWFCDQQGICAYRRAGKLLYRDDGHLSTDGARLLQHYLARQLPGPTQASMSRGVSAN